MQKLHFAITINAPKEKVWNTMLNDSTYRQWTDIFNPGSYFEGSWEQGAEIRFLGPNDHGVLSGMVGRIKENRLHEFVSIEYLGVIMNGKEDTSSDDIKKWAGAFENYTFNEKNGATELLIDVDSNDEFKKMFEDLWPKALQKLKEISEKPAVKVTVETIVQAPIDKVWASWNEPNHVTQWAFASDDWEAPHAENDLQIGGKFKTTMAAKDGSASFDFAGIYSNVKTNELIEYAMADGRQVKIEFAQLPDGVKVTETFDIEDINSKDMQQAGWQSILDNFKKHTETIK